MEGKGQKLQRKMGAKWRDTEKEVVDLIEQINRYIKIKKYLKTGWQWIVTDKVGNKQTFHNLSKFCENNNLQMTNLIRTQEGMERKWHKGYRVSKRVLEQDSIDKMVKMLENMEKRFNEIGLNYKEL